MLRQSSSSGTLDPRLWIEEARDAGLDPALVILPDGRRSLYLADQPNPIPAVSTGNGLIQILDALAAEQAVRQ